MKRNRLKRKGKPTRLAFFKPQLDAKTAMMAELERDWISFKSHNWKLKQRLKRKKRRAYGSLNPTIGG